MSELHFVEDYKTTVKRLIKENDYETAMSLAVGGNWKEMGLTLSKFVQS